MEHQAQESRFFSCLCKLPVITQLMMHCNIKIVPYLKVPLKQIGTICQQIFSSTSVFACQNEIQFFPFCFARVPFFATSTFFFGVPFSFLYSCNFLAVKLFLFVPGFSVCCLCHEKYPYLLKVHFKQHFVVGIKWLYLSFSAFCKYTVVAPPFKDFPCISQMLVIPGGITWVTHCANCPTVELSILSPNLA